jgi:hypothetical protein
MSRRIFLAGAALVLAAGVTGAVLVTVPTSAAPARHATAAPCPAGYTCINTHLLVRDPGTGSGYANQLLVEDRNGAPMLWVSLFGLYSGGEPVCVTGLRLQPLACIGGPQGSYGGRPVVVLYDARGRPVTLTVADLAWLHRAEKRRPAW